MCPSAYLPIPQIFFNFPSFSTPDSLPPLHPLSLHSFFPKFQFFPSSPVPLRFFRGSFLSMLLIKSNNNHKSHASEHKVIYFITHQDLGRMCLEICSHFTLELKLLTQHILCQKTIGFSRKVYPRKHKAQRNRESMLPGVRLMSKRDELLISLTRRNGRVRPGMIFFWQLFHRST